MKIAEFKTIGIIVVLMMAQVINKLPWWSFLIAVLLLGLLITKKRWIVRTFYVGFISGFIVWFFGNLYFHMRYNGIILHKIAGLVSMPVSGVMIISGILGGLVTGLSLYTGKQLIATNNHLSL